MTINSGMWAVIVPAERRNLASNPSLELGTTGWGTLQGGTVGTISSVQAFGAWAGSIAPSSNGTAGALGPTFTAGNGTAYSYSVYGSLPVGSVYRFGIGDSNGASIVGTFLGTGGGTWHRYIGSFTEASGATRRLAVRKNTNAATDAFYLDGLQYEAGSVTTYLDGDQEGCLWDGAPHLSTSLRSGTSRAGGSIYSLNDLGMRVLEHGGIGMPDLTNVMQDYGLLDGAYYQRTRANVRAFILTGLFSGSTYQGLHALRQQLIDVLKIDLTPNPQPTRFLFNGAGGLSQIDALYDSGLQFGERSGFAETAAIRFVAPDPYFYTTLDRGTAMLPQQNIGSANYIIRRDPQGRWGTLGIAGTTTNSGIGALAYQSGTLFVGGTFTTAGGTASGALAMYANNAWGTLGGTVIGQVRAILPRPTGTILFGGSISGISGIANVRFVGQWSGAGFGTVNGGTVTGQISSMVNGYSAAYFGGSYSSANGNHLVGWAESGYIAVGTPALVGATQITALAYRGGDNRLFVGFDDSVTVNGTATEGIALQFMVNGSWGTMPGGLISQRGADALAILPSARLVVAGHFRYAGIGSAPGDAVFWNDSQFIASYGTLNTQFADTALVVNALAVQNERTTYAAGDRQAIVQTAGGTWVDVGMPSREGWLALLLTPDNTLYAAGQQAGTLTTAAVTTVVNQASANSAARITFRYIGTTGGAFVDHIINFATGDQVFFDLILNPSEVVTVTLGAGARSGVVSTMRGNLLNTVIGGANLARWRLAPGTNYVSISAHGSIATQIVYRPRLWSADENLI